MPELDTPREPGLPNLFATTLLVLYSGLLALTGGQAHAAPAPGTALEPDGDLVARLKQLRYRTQLVLKLNVANPLASRAMMHTSHRSHSSHSSHYSSSYGGGHSSHSSHSSHYSSSYGGGSSGYGSGSSGSSGYGSGSSGYGSGYSRSLGSSRRSTRSRTSTGRSRTTRTRVDYSAIAATPYTLGDRVLQLGDQGADVVALQQLLLIAGYSSVTADGVFGLGTNAAVKQFQAAHALPADGVVGARTVAALRQ